MVLDYGHLLSVDGVPMKAYCKYCQSETIVSANSSVLSGGQPQCIICITGRVVYIPDAVEATPFAVDAYETELRRKLVQRKGL